MASTTALGRRGLSLAPTSPNPSHEQPHCFAHVPTERRIIGKHLTDVPTRFCLLSGGTTPEPLQLLAQLDHQPAVLQWLGLQGSPGRGAARQTVAPADAAEALSLALLALDAHRPNPVSSENAKRAADRLRELTPANPQERDKLDRALIRLAREFKWRSLKDPLSSQVFGLFEHHLPQMHDANRRALRQALQDRPISSHLDWHAKKRVGRLEIASLRFSLRDGVRAWQKEPQPMSLDDSKRPRLAKAADIILGRARDPKGAGGTVDLHDFGMSGVPTVLPILQQLADCADSGYPAITSLDLRSNLLTRLDASLGKFTALKTLDVSNNFVHEIDRGSLDQLAELETLDLANNRLTVFPDLSHLPKLKSIDVSGNHLPSRQLDKLKQWCNECSVELKAGKQTPYPSAAGYLGEFLESIRSPAELLRATRYLHRDDQRRMLKDRPDLVAWLGLPGPDWPQGRDMRKQPPSAIGPQGIHPAYQPEAVAWAIVASAGLDDDDALESALSYLEFLGKLLPYRNEGETLHAPPSDEQIESALPALRMLAENLQRMPKPMQNAAYRLLKANAQLQVSGQQHFFDILREEIAPEIEKDWSDVPVMAQQPKDHSRDLLEEILAEAETDHWLGQQNVDADKAKTVKSRLLDARERQAKIISGKEPDDPGSPFGLDLSHVGMRRLPPLLARLTELKSLTLGGNAGLTDISALETLTDLTSLTLAGTGVRDLRAISRLRHLEQLDLRGIPMDGSEKVRWPDLRGLGKLTVVQVSVPPLPELTAPKDSPQSTEAAQAREREAAQAREQLRKLPVTFLAQLAAKKLGGLSEPQRELILSEWRRRQSEAASAGSAHSEPGAEDTAAEGAASSAKAPGAKIGLPAKPPSLAESISDFLGSKISSLGSSVPSTPLDIEQRPDTTAALRAGHRQYRRLRQLEPHAPQSRLRNDELRRWLGVDVPHVTPDISVHPEALPRALAWFITRCSDGEDVQRALRQLGKLLDDPHIEPKYKGAALRRLAAGLHRIELPGVPEQALELITAQRLRELPSRFVRNSIDRDLRRLFEHPSVSLRAQAELLVWESELQLQIEDLRKPLPGESQQAALNRKTQAKALEGEYHARRELAGRIRVKRDESTPTTGLDLSRHDEDPQGVSGLPAIAIGQLLGLKSLNLSGQPIHFLPPSLHRLEHLETLDISRTRLGSQIETVFKLIDKAPKLITINLSEVVLTRRALDAVKIFTATRAVDIDYSKDFRTDWLNENLIDKVGATATLQDCLTHAEKTHQKLGVAFIDIDHFGQINKTYGELVGDAALRHFCEVTVRQALDKVMGSAPEPIFARWGGEEFLLLAPGKGRQAMTELVRQLRQALAQEPFVIESKPFSAQAQKELTLRFSAGVTAYEGEGEPDLALPRAVELMRDAKRAGRDQIKSGAIAAQPASPTEESTMQQQGTIKKKGMVKGMDDDETGPTVAATSTSSTVGTQASGLQAGSFDEARWQQWLSGIVQADPARTTRQTDYARLYEALAKASADVAANATTVEQARHFARGCAYALFGVGPGANHMLTTQGTTRRRIDVLSERIDSAFVQMGA